MKEITKTLNSLIDLTNSGTIKWKADRFGNFEANYLGNKIEDRDGSVYINNVHQVSRYSSEQYVVEIAKKLTRTIKEKQAEEFNISIGLIRKPCLGKIVVVDGVEYKLS